MSEPAGVSAERPLYNVEAEESLLGAMMLAERARMAAAEAGVTAEMLSPRNAEIYLSILRVAESGDEPDAVAVIDELTSSARLAAVGGPARVMDVLRLTPSTTAAPRYASIVARLARRRQLLLAADELATIVREEGDTDAVVARIAELAGAAQPMCALAAGAATAAVRWLWAGRIPYGKITLCDGAPGECKSLVAIDIAARITKGLPMADGTVPERGRGGVLIISAEDALGDTIGPRLRAAAADLEMVHIMRLDAPLSLPRDLGVLAQMTESLGVHLIIIDPLVAYLSRDVDTHNDASVRMALSPLTTMAAEAQVAVMAIRHLNKGVGLTALDRGGGSVGIGAAARSVLLFGRHPEDPTRHVMAVAKGNLSARAATLGFGVEAEPLLLDDGRAVEIPSLAWERAPVALTADQLVGYTSDGRRDAPERDAAAAWLAQVLAEGPLPAGELAVLAEVEGHAWRTVERAKDGVAVSVRERGDDGLTTRWVWRAVD